MSKTDQSIPDEVSAVRRKLLATTLVATGSLTLRSLAYRAPALRTFFGHSAAWAQQTPPPVQILQGFLGTGVSGAVENTGSDWWQLDVRELGTTIQIAVTTEPHLDVELFLFAPGDPPATASNLLTGSPAP